MCVHIYACWLEPFRKFGRLSHSKGVVDKKSPNGIFRGVLYEMDSIGSCFRLLGCYYSNCTDSAIIISEQTAREMTPYPGSSGAPTSLGTRLATPPELQAH